MTTKAPGGKNAKDQPQAKARIDSKAEILEPIDFSFKELMNIRGRHID
jgi:hypothetical protein